MKSVADTKKLKDIVWQAKAHSGLLCQWKKKKKNIYIPQKVCQNDSRAWNKSNIQNILNMQDNIIITTQVLHRFHIQKYRPSLHKNHSSTQYKERVFKYLLNATLNCVFSFLRLVRPSGKVLKVSIPAQHTLFWKHEMVLIPIITTVYRLISSKICLINYS